MAEFIPTKSPTPWKQASGRLPTESVVVTCAKCGTVHTLKVNPGDVDKWRNGELIQSAMPYLAPTERELLISGICGPCFDEMFD